MINNNNSLIIFCYNCRTKLKLDSNDLLTKQFICPRCKRLNYIPEQKTEQKLFVPIVKNKNPKAVNELFTTKYVLLFSILIILIIFIGSFFIVKFITYDDKYNKEKRMIDMVYLLGDNIIAKYFLYDNDSWYTIFSQVGKKKIDLFRKTDIMYYQLKNFTYKIDKEELNEADILNGYEWKGSVWSYAKLYRTATSNKNNIQFQWGDWTQSNYPHCHFEIEKYKGDWKIKKSVWTDVFLEYNLDEYFSKPRIEELPK